MNQWISDGITLAVLLAILAFLWNLHRDMAGLRERMGKFESAMLERIARFESDMQRQIAELRERMARLEGLFEGFTKNKESS